MLQPRLGVSYLVKRTNTVLRGSYTRNFETPYNENLILSSATGAGGLGNGILGDTSNLPLSPGRRNQFNFGFQQSLGSHLILEQTTQVQYQLRQWKRVAPYVAFTWRYDSGLVSGAVPDFDTALTFPADQQAQIGLFCGSTFATPTQAITTCSDSNREEATT
jgi:hypothetical protein